MGRRRKEKREEKKEEEEKEMIKKWSLVFFIFLLIQVKADDGFITAKGVHLMLNGSPFYANGFNAYWLMNTGANPYLKDKVSSVFQQAKEHGLSMARTWAFSDGGDSPLQYSPGSYNEQMFQVTNFYISVFFQFVYYYLNLFFDDFCFILCLQGIGFCNI